ncbi:hypothetical protein [Actinomadura sp. K4S16]|uniref:hypothetical protein n=1 Tax=Actinomadura sp. K4S16 TaxID=1316147 RepID=UPI0011EF9D09|nr:hypothetical protein [Actinomadura sp. K4S16]
MVSLILIGCGSVPTCGGAVSRFERLPKSAFTSAERQSTAHRASSLIRIVLFSLGALCSASGPDAAHSPARARQPGQYLLQTLVQFGVHTRRHSHSMLAMRHLSRGLGLFHR